MRKLVARRAWFLWFLFLLIPALFVRLAQAQSGCPEGCTFVCVQPTADCGCYGYCICSEGTPPPTATPIHDPHYDVCYQYTYRCDWSCTDLALGELKKIFRYVDCVTGGTLFESVEEVYPCGACRRTRDCYQPGACTPTPARTTPTPGPTPTPEPCGCPGPQEILGTPSYQVYQTPPHPVVVGQGGSGITVRVVVTLPDWTLRQWRREPRLICVPGAAGPGQTACTLINGQPGHMERRDGECSGQSCPVICQGINGCAAGVCWMPFCTSWDERYPEYATGGTISLRLRQSSIDWIRTELATRYPGARVYQQSWQTSARVVAAYDTGSATVCVLEAYFPVRDPGYYDISATVTSTKRVLTIVSQRPASAYLIDSSIIR